MRCAPYPFAVLGLVLLSLSSGASAAAAASREAPKPAAKDAGVAAGLVIEKAADFLSIQVDGEEDPTKFLLGGQLDKRSQDALKGIFDVNRVQVRYKMDGGDRRITGIEKIAGRAQGVVVGEVVKVYKEFWVAVKPNGGMIEGFALNGPPDKVKAAADVLKSLKKGDVVAIRYATDGERHRILQIELKPAGKK